jgi:oligopeptide transport system substrate-binding protein
MLAANYAPYRARGTSRVPWAAYAAAWAIAALAPAGCRRDADIRSTLRFHNMAEPRTLDPAGATGIPEKNLLLALAEGLTTFDPVTAAPAPGVAARHEFSDGGRTLTFFLRDCTWSNGDPVTSHDFRASWLRVLDPATASPLATVLFGVRGARDYHEGRGAASGVGIETPDDRTLVVRFTAPQPWFLQLTASSPLVPVHGKTVSAAGAFVRPERFVGNGPFVLAERVPNHRIVMKKNVRYWDAAHVTIETLVAYAGENKQTAVDAFRAGRTDWVDDFPGAQADSWRGRPELRLSPYLGIYFLRLNTTKPPLSDRRVREAIHLAIDRAKLCDRVTRLGQRPASWLVPHSIGPLTGYPPAHFDIYNPERARQLLEEAGYPGGAGFPKVEYQFDTNEDHKRVAEAIQTMLKENLGIEVYLMNKEKKAIIDDEENLRYPGMSRGSWIADYVDPATFLDIFETGSPGNRTGFSNAAYDRLLADARAEGDPARRMRILADAESLLLTKEFPVVPIYEYVKQTLVNPARIVDGFHENPLGFHPMKWIRLAPP